MTTTEPPTAVIVGVGPFTSLSLGRKLASLGWNIGLISRSEDGLKKYAADMRSHASHKNQKIIFRAADAVNRRAICAALEWAKNELGKIDVLCYNAARVAPSDLMTLSPEVLTDDFNISVLGTLDAGQWFAQNANKSNIAKGEHPLFLVPTGAAHLNPLPAFASLSTVKSASYNLSGNFSQVLPEQYGVKVGIPIINGRIIPKEDGGYATKWVPDVIVEEIFMPFFEQRKADGAGAWTRERVF